MMLGRIAFLMIVLGTPAAAQSQEKVPPSWSSSNGVAKAKGSGIAVPLKAGSLTNFALRDANGDGADVAAQYDSPDGKILGTIFIYAPTRPDAALTFLATDEAIMRRFGSSARKVQDELVAVAGVGAGGRRAIYTGVTDSKLSGDPDGRIYSGAAFIRAGEWMMKIRVSGPISRSDEISRNLDMLITGLSFEKRNLPLPQTKILPTDCSPSPDRPSITIDHPASSDALALTFMLDPDVTDEKGNSLANPMTTSIVGLCREPVELRKDVAIQTYRVSSMTQGPFIPRHVMLYGDAGIMLLAFEDSKQPGRYFVSRHGIGRTYILGRMSSMPNKAELRSMLLDPTDQPAVVRVTRDYLGNKTDVLVNCTLTIEGCGKK